MSELPHSIPSDLNNLDLSTADSATQAWSSVRPDLQVRSGRLIAGVVDHDDRLGHAFWFQGVAPSNLTEERRSESAAVPILVMSSFEGTPQESWPASSPFQQIVLEEIGTEKKPVLLAVGMAGKTHWSGTIEGDGMTEAIAMDFAARVNVIPEFVGSTYLVHDAWEIQAQSSPDSSNQSVQFKHKSTDIELLIDSIGSNPISVSGNRMTITFKADFPPTKRTQTLRWRYVIRSL